MGEERLPKNLQGLLRFCMQAGDNPPTSAAPMDPERTTWLREALDNLTVDIGKRLKESIAKILQNIDSAGGGDAEASAICLDSLEDTADLCENLDIANDFVKLGGLDVAAFVCQKCAGRGSSGEDLRCSALHLMARLFQNNPFAQTAGLGCVADLVSIVSVVGDNEQVRFAALSALSCLVRDCPQALTACADAAGLAAVAGCLRPSGASGSGLRLRRKAAFLLSSLAAESDACADLLAGVDGLPDTLVDCILDAAAEVGGDPAEAVGEDAAARLDWLEHALGCLLRLCQRAAASDCCVLGKGDDSGRRQRRLAAGLESLHQCQRLPSDCTELAKSLLELLLRSARLEDDEALGTADR